MKRVWVETAYRNADFFRVLKPSALKHSAAEIRIRDRDNGILNSFSLGTIRFSVCRNVSDGTRYFS